MSSVAVSCILTVALVLTPVLCRHDGTDDEYEDATLYYDDDDPLVIYDDHRSTKPMGRRRDVKVHLKASQPERQQLQIDITGGRLSYNQNVVRKLDHVPQATSRKAPNGRSRTPRRNAVRKQRHKGRRTALVQTKIVLGEEQDSVQNDSKTSDHSDVLTSTTSKPIPTKPTRATQPRSTRRLRPSTTNWAFPQSRHRKARPAFFAYDEVRPQAQKPEEEKRRRSAISTIICLIVAVLALLFVLLILSIIAIVIRKRYRAHGKSRILYTTLKDRDPDLDLRPIKSSREIVIKKTSSMPRPSSPQPKSQVFQSASEPAISPRHPNNPERRKTRDLQEDVVVASTAPETANAATAFDSDPESRSRPSTREGARTSFPTSSTTTSNVSSGHDRGRKTLRIPSPKRNVPTTVGEQKDAARDTAVDKMSEPQEEPSFSEDYHQYSESDDVQLMFDINNAPLPTYIRRTMTRTTRRWRDDVPSTTTSNATSTEVIRRPPQSKFRPSSTPDDATDDGKAIRLAGSCKLPQHTETDCFAVSIDMATNVWREVLTQCRPSYFVDFLFVMHEDCHAIKLREGRDCQVFRVLGSQGERVLQVEKVLSDDDVRNLSSRLRIAEELSKLKDTVDNRTSSFFLDMRTYCVRDSWPSVLGNASKGPISDTGTLNYYLVSEIQTGWEPITTVELEDSDQAQSILTQTACALAVAEAALEFEHRLLTPDCILVRATRSPKVEITLRGRIHRIDSHGFKIRIQGFHLSRMRIGSQVVHIRFLSYREHIAEEKDRRIHKTYGKIASHLNQRGSKFVPRTNVLWLCYLAEWLIDQISEEADVFTLRQWKAQLKKCNSATECATFLLQ